MLSRTTTLICRRCLANSLPRIVPVYRPRLTKSSLPLSRSYAKKAKHPERRPEDVPEHIRVLILGKRLVPNPANGKLYLKDLEQLRDENNKRLRGHRKGALYQASLHGKAELVAVVMKAIDRLAVQEDWDTLRKLRLLPNHTFYVMRAYGALHFDQQSDFRPLSNELEPEFSKYFNPSKARYSLWNQWRFSSSKETGMLGNSTRGSTAQASALLKRFMERFTDVEGSEMAKSWSSPMAANEDSLSKKGALTASSGLESRENRRPRAPAQAAVESTFQKPIAPLESENPRKEIPQAEPTLKLTIEPLEESEKPREEIPQEEVPEIWKPNQQDISLRQSTFSHPSEATLKSTHQQLRSSWAPSTFHDLSLVRSLPSAIETITLGHLGKSHEISLTDIQALAIPAITKLDATGFENEKTPFRSFLIAADTGSGKTLAYLVPLINRLKEEEEWALKNTTSEKSIFNTHRAASPRAVILVPTSELAEQIYNILKRLSHELKFRVCALLPKFDDSVVRKSILPTYIDILISTPHRLNEFIQNDEIKTNHVKYLIIDEADTIFDRSFLDTLNPILSTVESQLTHLVLCSATIPLALEEHLSKSFPDMQRIVSTRIHSGPRRINFQVKVESDKRQGLLDNLHFIQASDTEPDRDIRRSIIFCNTREGVRDVYEYLKSADEVEISRGGRRKFELIPFTRDNFDRHTALKRFNEPATEKSDKLRLLITTDMASRGLDTLLVKTVILYDVPYSNIDLLHRLGRTARIGTRGRALMIVSKAEYRGRTKQWVNEIRHRLITGEALV
jgi:ATP-dependent RNA helicase MRH4, mitochondrial